MKQTYFLHNSYEDRTVPFDTREELIEYLKIMNSNGTLMGETVFHIFIGRHLATESFWEEAFPNKNK
jgi:hypothetical protein